MDHSARPQRGSPKRRWSWAGLLCSTLWPGLLACVLLLLFGARWMRYGPRMTATEGPVAAHTGGPSKHMRQMFLASSSQTKQYLGGGEAVDALGGHELDSSSGQDGDELDSSSGQDGDELDSSSGQDGDELDSSSGQDGDELDSSSGQDGDVEVWARGLPSAGEHEEAGRAAVRALIPELVRANLSQLCGRCLYRTLTSYTHVRGQQGTVFVETGDIPAMWTRDSAVQAGSYIPRIPKQPFIRGIVEGALRALAYFILQDPWANAYRPRWQKADTMNKYDRQLGRGGFVWTRNFELDSAGYFFNFLNNYYRSPGVWGADVLLRDPLMHDAVLTMLRVLETEQDHEKRSPYRYSELSRDGLGPPCTVTGMVWSGFRPSDDMNKYSYSIPSNMYVAGALERLAAINLEVWRDPLIANLSARLARDMRASIERWGVVPVPGQAPGAHGSTMMYAYEVDGLGNALADFDDPNLPSLLAIPLLGWRQYDQQTYLNTRARILSPSNPYYFTGAQLKGMGSPHTPDNHIWPLAHIVQALTSDDAGEKASLLQDLLQMSLGNGLVHESVNVNNPHQFTRPEFGWANALTVVAVEQLLGVDCDAAAEEIRLQAIAAREAKADQRAANGGKDRPYYYELLSAQVNHA